MRNILTVFLIQYLLLNRGPGRGRSADGGQGRRSTTSSRSSTSSRCSGGFIADRFFGKYRTILWLSLLYCVGHLLLAVFDDNRQGFYAGLFLIALGSGGIKPCVSAFVGDQFTEQNKGLVKGVFAPLLLDHQLRLVLRLALHPAHPAQPTGRRWPSASRAC